MLVRIWKISVRCIFDILFIWIYWGKTRVINQKKKIKSVYIGKSV